MTKPLNTLPDADLLNEAVSKFVKAQASELPPGAKPDPNDHPRDTVMESAGRELVAFLEPWVTRYSLTMSEYLYLLAVPMHQQIQAMCIHEREHMAKESK
jgi:hypothetical protein